AQRRGPAHAPLEHAQTTSSAQRPAAVRARVERPARIVVDSECGLGGNANARLGRRAGARVENSAPRRMAQCAGVSPTAASLPVWTKRRHIARMWMQRLVRESR